MRASEFVEILAPIVGLETATQVADRVAEEWGGRSEAIFCGRAVDKVRRNFRLVAEVADGATVNAVAAKYGISRKQALRIIEGLDL